MPVAYYEILPGFLVFECDRLHSSLSAKACSDNFVNRKCFACADCPTGRIHAGKATQTTPDPIHRPGECVRCLAQTTRRQIGAAWCLSCYNRQCEALAGRNRKGAFPRRIAAHLHRCEATLAGDDLLEKFYSPAQRNHDALPRLTLSAPSTYRLETIVTDADELGRLIARRAPGATIINFEISPSFLECRAQS